MIMSNESTCPKCGGVLKYYDRVPRIVRTKRRTTTKVFLRRLRCQQCRALHRELPDFIFPYKQYEAEIIIGVVEGLITCETLGFEDYPCETTMIRWRLFPPRLFSQKAVAILE
jgi:transposase